MELFFLLVLLSQSDAAAQQQASLAAQRASIGVQGASVRKQLHMTPAAPGSFFVTSDPPTTAGDIGCEPLPVMRQRALTDTAAKHNGISSELLDAVIRQESAFRPCSVSEKGAQGLMQLMPATAEQFGVTDPFDPDQNVEAGAALLKQLLTKYSGDLNRTLGAYNAGSGNVDKAGGVPAFPETMKYVEGILGKLGKKY